MRACEAVGAVDVRRDAYGNVRATVPGSPSIPPDSPSLVLQAHLDMVAVSAVPHDFATQPLNLQLTQRASDASWWLSAVGTTLGADDGVGVAALLSVAEAMRAGGREHLQLELVMTLDEEAGLIGASRLGEGMISERAKFLVNVDGDPGAVIISAAGGVTRRLRVPVRRERAGDDVGWEAWEFEIGGLRGGHTGDDIHLGRLNALKLAASVMTAAAAESWRLVSMNGGDVDNAIPASLRAEVLLRRERANEVCRAWSDAFHAGFWEMSPHERHVAGEEPRLGMRRLEGRRPTGAPLTWASTMTVLSFLSAVHHGVFSWSERVQDLVETSQSLSIVTLSPNSPDLVTIVFSRSSNESALSVAPRLLQSIAELYGGTCDGDVPGGGDFVPAWPLAPSSRLSRLAVVALTTDPQSPVPEVAKHYGLECGAIMNQFPKNNLEAISIGAVVLGEHTVNEKLPIRSAADLYHSILRLVALVTESL